MDPHIQSELVKIKTQLHSQRRLTKFLIAGWLVTLSVGLIGATKQPGVQFFKELKVGRLALVDSSGTERVILVNDSSTVRVNGKDFPRKPLTTGILLQNAKGDEVAGFAMGDNGQTVLMLDGYSKLTPYGESERAGLVSLPDGTAGLYLTDLKGNLRAKLITDSNLNSELLLMDQEGKSPVKGSVATDGKTTWKASK